MKKAIAGMAAALLLAGCGAQEAPLETVGPGAYAEPARAAAGELIFWIPEEAGSEALAAEDGSRVYTWDSYELRLQTVEGGDIRKTVEQLTGMDYDRLTVMAREKGNLDFYQTVWCSEGEEGTLLSRAVVADDGAYHYCVSLTAPEEVDSAQVYARICSTLSVTEAGAKK